MKSQIARIALGLAAGLALAAPLRAQIVIGQTSGFTGAVAAGVKENTEGAKLYFDHVNASGGINPHAVDHAVKLGGKIVWMPTLSAANHIKAMSAGNSTFPKTSQKMLDPIPLSALDANRKLTDDTKKVIDLIAEADIILAGGHLPASELHILFDEAARRGVKKMMVNHPTYIVGCSDTDIRQLVARGVKMEHSICMFIEGKSLKYSPDDLAHLIEVAGVDNTILSSDLGLQGSQRPVDGFRSITQILLDLQMPRAAIRKLISDNAAGFLNLPVSQSAAQNAA